MKWKTDRKVGIGDIMYYSGLIITSTFTISLIAGITTLDCICIIAGVLCVAIGLGIAKC